MRINLKSVHASACERDGHRYLIETFWPERLNVGEAVPFGWPRELAPSAGLARQSVLERWTWERFKEEYWNELEIPDKKAVIERMRREAEEDGITLLYAGYSPVQSYASLLKEFLEAVPVTRDDGSGGEEMEMAAA